MIAFNERLQPSQRAEDNEERLRKATMSKTTLICVNTHYLDIERYRP